MRRFIDNNIGKLLAKIFYIKNHKVYQGFIFLTGTLFLISGTMTFAYPSYAQYELSWLILFGIWLIALECCIIAIFISSRYQHYHKSKIAFLSSMAIGTIILYASIYVHNGISATSDSKTIEWSDAIYFSIVTFTTLGYGDYTPSGYIKLFAASEALLGYIYLGFLVALSYDSLQSYKYKNSKGKKLKTRAIKKKQFQRKRPSR